MPPDQLNAYEFWDSGAISIRSMSAVVDTNAAQTLDNSALFRLPSACVSSRGDFRYSRLSRAAMPGGEFKQGRR
jgi:hypothetical protein